MIIRHVVGKNIFEKRVNNSPGCLVTNNSGGFFAYGLDSKYQGFFCRLGDKLLKIMDCFIAKDDIKRITNHGFSASVESNIRKESFFMPLNKNSLVYESDKIGSVDIFLDVCEPYDNRRFGKNYNITIENKKAVVEFVKSYDGKDGDLKEGEEYKIYIAILGDKSFCANKVERWIKKNYSFDTQRRSYFERYAYHALQIVAKQIVFGVAETRIGALRAASESFKNMKRFKLEQQKNYKIDNIKLGDSEIDCALSCAFYSINSLLYENNLNIYAGLPWFFQNWSRDEAVSLKALLYSKKYDLVQKIISKQLDSIGEDGLLKNINKSLNSCADAIGSMFKRCEDITNLILKDKKIQNKFDKYFIFDLSSKLRKSLDIILNKYVHNGLWEIDKKQTWMDSIEREGSRIEIQAQLLMMCNLAFSLTNDEKYKKAEENLLQATRSAFFEGNVLKDGNNDSLIRPNIFIAAYLYPNLLSKDEWINCFKIALPKLWLDWGGLSSVDKNNNLFVSESTGEDPSSYHNGDSWFWINNLAALVLHRTDKEQFRYYIEKILFASTKEILYNGFIGHHAEISSASKFSSLGCWSQAWSSAMYIELVEEMFFD
jgi:glycogen debranching enzyme